MEAFLKGGAKPSSSSSKREKAAPTKKTEGRSVPWVEKYRPKIVSDIAHQEEVVSVLQKCVSGADLPNLLFYGPPGTGKTSAILAVARQLYGPEQMRSRMLELNASDERGIKVVREKVKSFARQAVSGTGPDGKPCPNFKLIVLDEADSMTSAAQAALRRTMEKQSKTTRFCLICNYISRIIEPLTSRCSKFRFKPLSSDILTERLQHISQTEGIACQPEVIERIINVSEGDMRKAITLLQSAHRLKGGSRGLTLADVDEIAGVAPEEVIQQLLKACYSDSYAALETCLKDIMAEGYSAYQLLSQLHDEVIMSEKVANKPKSIIVERMGLVEKRLMDGGDEYLQLMDICCAMMSQFCHPTED